VHEERCAIGTEVVGYVAASTDEHGCRGIGCDVDEYALLWLVVHCSAKPCFRNPRDLKRSRLVVSRLSEIHFVSRLAKRQLTERA